MFVRPSIIDFGISNKKTDTVKIIINNQALVMSLMEFKSLLILIHHFDKDLLIK